MKPALLVVDVQKEFFKFGPTTAQSLNDAIEYINAAIALFREKDLPVICVQQVDEEEKLAPGKEGFELRLSLSQYRESGTGFMQTTIFNGSIILKLLDYDLSAFRQSFTSPVAPTSRPAPLTCC